MAFVMTPAQIAQLKKKLNMFNRTVKRARDKNTSMGKDYLNDYMPREFDLETMQAVMYDEEEFYRWTEEGGLFDRARGKGALDVLQSDNGTRRTRWEKELLEENAAHQRAERERQTSNMETELYDGDEAVDFESMSPTERATAYAGNDLIPDDVGEADPSVEDVDAQTKARWEFDDSVMKEARSNVASKFWEYHGVWTADKNRHMKMPRGYEVASALTWLYENRPDVLEKMFNSGRDEMVVDYIYLNPKSTVYASIPLDDRHMNAASYILGEYEKVRAKTLHAAKRKTTTREERIEDAVEEQKENLRRRAQIKKMMKKGKFK